MAPDVFAWSFKAKTGVPPTTRFFCEERDTFHAASRDDAWRREALFAEELGAAG